MIGAIIFGIVAGYLGRWIMPGKRDIGFFVTTILGVIGAVVGFLIFTEVLGIGDAETFDFGGLPGAVIGVILILFLYDRFAGGRGAPAG